jgi:hypothetical protein
VFDLVTVLAAERVAGVKKRMATAWAAVFADLAMSPAMGDFRCLDAALQNERFCNALWRLVTECEDALTLAPLMRLYRALYGLEDAPASLSLAAGARIGESTRRLQRDYYE